MKEFTFNQTLAFISKMLETSGIYLSKAVLNKREKLMGFCLNAPLVVVTFFLFQTVMYSSDPGHITKLLIQVIGGVIHVTPFMITAVYGRHELRQLIDLVAEGTDESKMIDSSPMERILLRKYSGLAFKAATAVFITCLTYVVVLHLSPYPYSLLTSQWIIPTGLEVKGLSVTKHPGYDVVALTQAFAAIHETNFVAAFSMFSHCFSVYIAYKCDVCIHYISMLGQDPLETTRVLRKVLVTHTHLVRFHSLRVVAFQLAVFVQIMVCMSCIVLALANFEYYPLRFAMCIELGLSQMFVTCVFSEIVNHKVRKLRIEALQVSTEIYSCDWLCLVKRSDRHNFLILLLNSQIERYLKPFGGLITLSLDTFVRILKAIFSYYTFLTQVM